MTTYFKTQEETIEAANQAQKENANTHVVKSNFFCDCGESFACYLRHDETLEDIETFVYCEACHDEYE